LTTSNLSKAGDFMDTLSIERVWEDADFFEIEVEALSELVRARAKTYIPTGGIADLALELATFPRNPNDRYFWEAGGKDDNSTPYISLEFYCEDKLGHITVEIYMGINDGAPQSKHNCCFFIKTEIGLLNSFGKSLTALNERGTGKKIVLNEID